MLCPAGQPISRHYTSIKYIIIFTFSPRSSHMLFTCDFICGSSRWQPENVVTFLRHLIYLTELNIMFPLQIVIIYHLNQCIIFSRSMFLFFLLLLFFFFSLPHSRWNDRESSTIGVMARAMAGEINLKVHYVIPHPRWLGNQEISY